MSDDEQARLPTADLPPHKRAVARGRLERGGEDSPEGRSSGADGRGDSGPRTRRVARRLGVPGDRLEYFVSNHPDPSVGSILALANEHDASADTRRLVEQWLADEGGEP